MVTLFKSEAELFQDIYRVGYGDMYDVEVLEEGGLVELDLSPQDERFLALLKNGDREFYTIGVHNGHPAYAVISGITAHGNRFRKKIKFS